MDDVRRPEEGCQAEVSAVVQDRVSQLRAVARLRVRKQRRSDRVALFHHRLRRYWGDALDSLEELVAACAELGDLVAGAWSADTQLFTAVELLRTRAVQVGWEVHHLASAGYADGAYARWRTLHELAVVLEFLQKFGEDTAARYLDHVRVKNRKVVREYNECHEQLGYPPIPETEVAQSEKLKKELLSRYGDEFGNEWGWAAKACGNPDPSFFDLRNVSGYSHWKAHYGMANHAIHAGPHGILFRLGHPLNWDPRPLSGPSLMGIGTPVDAAGISVMHATFSLVAAVARKPDDDVERQLEMTAAIRFIADLSRDVGAHVLEASHHVEAEFGHKEDRMNSQGDR